MLHWVDNTGALAALAKGYSKAADGSRLLHALSAIQLDRGIDPWFAYVRLKANIADLPSRAAFDDSGYIQRLGSHECTMHMPPMSAWERPFEHLHSPAGRLKRPRPNKRARKSKGHKTHINTHATHHDDSILLGSTHAS